MTNALAIWLFTLIAGFFIVDALLLGWDSHIVVMKYLLELIGWLAFWR